MQMVGHGRATLTLDSLDVLNFALKNQDPSLADNLEILPYVLATHGVHMAVNNRHPDHIAIVAAFNTALKEMRDDGSLSLIYERHK